MYIIRFMMVHKVPNIEDDYSVYIKNMILCI